MTAEPTQATPGGAPAGVRSRGQRLRRGRIVRAAAALAARGGVEEMQMRKVADRAGVALGTLYRYFPSKMDLVVAVVTEELDLLEGSLTKRPPTAATPAGRAVDVLMRATRGLMREPELADALIRSLITSDVRTDMGNRVAGLLLRAAAGDDPDRDTGAGPSARPARPENLRADSPEARRHLLTLALTSVWVMALIELLRGKRTVDDIQRHLELAADRLLGDF